MKSTDFSVLFVFFKEKQLRARRRFFVPGAHLPHEPKKADKKEKAKPEKRRTKGRPIPKGQFPFFPEGAPGRRAFVLSEKKAAFHRSCPHRFEFFVKFGRGS